MFNFITTYIKLLSFFVDNKQFLQPNFLKKLLGFMRICGFRQMFWPSLEYRVVLMFVIFHVGWFSCNTKIRSSNLYVTIFLFLA